MPTATASDAARISCTSRRLSSPVTHRRAGHGDLAVERDRDLVGDERPAARDQRPPRLVLRARLEAVVELGLDAGLAQPLETAGRLGVRVARAGHDARHARGDRRLRARRRRAPVRARLHRHVERRAARPLARRGERDDLAVPAARLGDALADDLAVRDDDRADRRLRVRAAAARRRPAPVRARGSSHASTTRRPRRVTLHADEAALPRRRDRPPARARDAEAVVDDIAGPDDDGLGWAVSLWVDVPDRGRTVWVLPRPTCSRPASPKAPTASASP